MTRSATTPDLPADIVTAAARHAALGEPVRLAIAELLKTSDRTPAELQRRLGLASNLLSHHLEVLANAGLVRRRRSSGDARRRYVSLQHDALPLVGRPIAGPATNASATVLFVCTRNSARSPLAAALWQRVAASPALSAGTHPAERVDPGARAAARRRGLDLAGVTPRHLDEVIDMSDVVVTVCDQAHEELRSPDDWLHWSVPDPVGAGSVAAYDAVCDDLEARIMRCFCPPPWFA